jgi:steroid delta-isomerase-like uncharacterized protein
MTPTDEPRRNLAVIRRFYDQLWNQWRIEIAQEILSNTIHFRSSLGSIIEGREAFTRYMETVRAAFPDFHHRVDDMLAAEDRVAARVTYSGTHRGPLAGIEPTEARVEYVGAGFFRLAGGIVQEGWVVGDTQEIWRALGRLET